MASTSTLPEDLQLEIIARSDIASIIRSAAATKSLRRRILDDEFRRLHSAVNGSHLLGVSYRYRIDRATFKGVTDATSSHSHLRFNPTLLESFSPVVSRDGLIVLKKIVTNNGGRGGGFHYMGVYNFDMCVCNAFTGDVTPLPPNQVNLNIYPPALLDVNGRRSSFDLLVVTNFGLQTQTFSSKKRRWMTVRAAELATGHEKPHVPIMGSFPAIVGRTVHWLGCTRDHRELGVYSVIILALRVDDVALQARTIQLPNGCVDRMLGCGITKSMDELMLVASAGGTELGLVVAERDAISVWTMSLQSWSRRVVIKRVDIDRSLEASKLYLSIHFEGFGERSGIVLLRMTHVGLVQVNLATGKAVVVRDAGSEGWSAGPIDRGCLHEMDLYSVLQGMNSFGPGAKQKNSFLHLLAKMKNEFFQLNY